MARVLTYDDSQLREMYEALDEKQRLKAMRGAFRSEANRFRKAAIQHVRGSIRTDKDLEKGVRSIVYKQSLGFRVTVGTAGKTKGYHLNRQGLLKPVLLWAEDGTVSRYTKNGGGRFHRASRKRKVHYTGRMKAYLFIDKTRRDLESSVTENLHQSIRKYVANTAKRYGCIV